MADFDRQVTDRNGPQKYSCSFATDAKGVERHYGIGTLRRPGSAGNLPDLSPDVSGRQWLMPCLRGQRNRWMALLICSRFDRRHSERRRGGDERYPLTGSSYGFESEVSPSARSTMSRRRSSFTRLYGKFSTTSIATLPGPEEELCCGRRGGAPASLSDYRSSTEIWGRGAGPA